ncbi:tetratricopeptide repeat protein [Marinicella sediminis]|uniref:Tetratricopeptide repeat protein n=1 Tax=Marinicella sediminis TaxID=1792834 RepID=A0ABV7JC35_9GAMM|nr:tetratricopeptide repeat protein [Marinicella sediminis]
MKYRFAGFELDLKTNELHHGSQPIPLTRQGYHLLVYLLSHADQIHSKDDLIAHVWKGRIVSDNTIDQSISKLRKLLHGYQSGDYIETVYGQGIRFIPEVTCTEKTTQPGKQKPILLVIVITCLGLMLWQFSERSGPTQPTERPQVMIISDTSNADWAQSGAEQMISQLLSYSGAATVRPATDRPRFIDQQSYITSQQSFNPQLITANTAISQQQGAYTLQLDLHGPQINAQKSFTGANLSKVMDQATLWLSENIGGMKLANDHLALIPSEGHVTELYLRALNSVSQNDFDKALKQLELVTEEAPGFLLGRFQLAHVLQLQNKLDRSLATLQTLSQLPVNNELSIAVTSLTAYILDTMGEYEQAEQIYEDLFKRHQNQVSVPLLKARYEYAYTLMNRNQASAAEQQLDWVLSHLNERTQPALQADVHALKGSLLQRQGEMKGASEQLQLALDMFERNRDSLGAAKTHSSLARIASHQANYALAESHLQESLAITREVGFKLGEGATLNELAYVLMVQGQHQRAHKQVQQLMTIATEIDYPAMQMAARQLFFDMAREQRDWSAAERHLEQHRQLAETTGHQRALIKNQMLALSLWVDAGQIQRTAELITALQQHIDEQQETRMQPRLDWLKARVLLQTGGLEQARQALEQALTLARQSEDGESIININNTLAEIHLQQNQPELALQKLDNAAAFKPFALPYLRLRALAYQSLGEPIKALETMNLCRQQAADLWTTEDSRLLDELTNQANTSMAETET